MRFPYIIYPFFRTLLSSDTTQKWRRQAAQKCWHLYTAIHGVIRKCYKVFTDAALSASNIAVPYLFLLLAWFVILHHFDDFVNPFKY